MKRAAMVLGLLGALLTMRCGVAWLASYQRIAAAEDLWKQMQAKQKKDIEALNRQLPPAAQVDISDDRDSQDWRREDDKVRLGGFTMIGAGVLALLGVLLVWRRRKSGGLVLFALGFVTMALPSLLLHTIASGPTVAGGLLFLSGVGSLAARDL
jgi:hypothetical protein